MRIKKITSKEAWILMGFSDEESVVYSVLKSLFL